MVRRTYWLSAIEALWREKSIVWLYRTFLHVRDYGGVSDDAAVSAGAERSVVRR